MNPHEHDRRWMRLALELAEHGRGYVEPNPLVGCVLVRESEGIEVGRGYHAQFGGPHAEAVALALAGERARGATAYVTLEPCAHYGKTPPCSAALIAAGISRVVVACADPFEQVNGRGIEQLVQAGIEVELGICRDEALELNRPFFKRVQTQLPWVIAKWAMSLDGKIATVTGQSKWITSELARNHAHHTRSCMDAILIGSRTARLDDPLLTARPAGLVGQGAVPGPRTPTRVIVDSLASLSIDSNLVRTAAQYPTLVAVGPEAPDEQLQMLQERHVEVWQCTLADRNARLEELLRELGRREMTNVLIEGGGQLLGAASTLDLIDEVHVYLAPCIIGGDRAPGPVGGCGIEALADRQDFRYARTLSLGDDWMLSARKKIESESQR